MFLCGRERPGQRSEDTSTDAERVIEEGGQAFGELDAADDAIDTERNPELPEDPVAGGTEETFDYLPGYGMMIRNGPEPPA